MSANSRTLTDQSEGQAPQSPHSGETCDKELFAENVLVREPIGRQRAGMLWAGLQIGASTNVRL
jgi:hypothetical protein